MLDDLYLDSKNTLECINISTQSIKYYARLVDQFTIHRLSQLEDWKRYFYLMCFIVHRYLRINDALIKTMLFQSHKLHSNVVSRVKEHISVLNIENLRNLKKGSEVLDLLTSTKLSDSDSIGLLRQKAYDILSKSKISRLSQFLKKSNVDVQELRWLEMDNAPLAHVPKAVLKYLYKTNPQGNVLDPFRYEYFIYKLLKKRLDSFEIFVPDSTEYKSLEKDLMSKSFYIQNKHNLHIEYDNDFLAEYIDTRVKRKLQELDDLLHVTNDRIIKGENKQVKPLQHSKSKWIVEYQGTENKDINNPVFQKIPKIDLPQLLWLVNSETHFLDAFTHILYKDAKLKPTVTHLIGTIIAFATNMGISKFASCSNVPYDTLKATRDTFFREDTLKLANDMIMNATSELPIHELYKIGGTIHSAVDGKKYDSAGHMFNARCSPKYFNLGKDVSILTLLINFMPAALKIISPTEYEGNYGLELLMMNETTIQSVINSTDMHGINDLNFALYDGAGYDFQPRYTNLFEASKQL